MSLVSIAICTYNGEKYLREQLDSICNQTYRDLEIVIYDDVSSDSTMEILDEYSRNDSRIKLHRNEKNLGFVSNFSQAISACTGDYIALADQDDIWKLDKIEKFLAEIGDNVLIYSDAILINDQGNPTGKQLVRPHHIMVSGSCNKAFLTTNCVSGNTLMFKKNLLRHILPIPEVSYHDVWIAFVASSIGTIGYTEEAMIYYRRHEQQVTKDKTKKRSFQSWLNRIRRKKEQKEEGVRKAIRDYTSYQRFISEIGDSSTGDILDELIAHYQKYRQTLINFRLRALLLAKQDEIFAILQPKDRANRAKRISHGYKYHRLTLFS